MTSQSALIDCWLCVTSNTSSLEVTVCREWCCSHLIGLRRRLTRLWRHLSVWRHYSTTASANVTSVTKCWWRHPASLWRHTAGWVRREPPPLIGIVTTQSVTLWLYRYDELWPILHQIWPSVAPEFHAFKFVCLLSSRAWIGVRLRRCNISMFTTRLVWRRIVERGFAPALAEIPQSTKKPLFLRYIDFLPAPARKYLHFQDGIEIQKIDNSYE